MTDQTHSDTSDTLSDEPEAGSGGWTVGGNDDPMLAQLVAFSRLGLSVGVTLTVGGSLISGWICDGKEFIEHVQSSVSDGDEKLTAYFEPYFKDQLEVYEDESQVRSVAYVHLRDSVVFTGPGRGVPSNGGVYWRGRLDAVEGWSMGLLTVSN